MAQTSCGRIARDNRRICLEMERLANRALAGEELNAMQAHMLLFIVDHSGEGTSLTAIQHEFGYSMAALSGMLKHLRKKGYVRSERCTKDDRCKLLFATPEGRRTCQTLCTVFCRADAEIYDGFSSEELLSLEKLQGKMLGNLSAITQKKEATQS